ncbi:MAG TPA: PAS domain S-box protein, partial [Anaerolineaceae bacterium]|nr:PAS domain S-box protein [Anaerolineaceae bacterium]
MGLFPSKKRIVAINYAIALFFYLASLTTDKMVSGVREMFWGHYITLGILSAPFLIFFCALIFLSLYLYFKYMKETELSIKRDQIRLLLISLAIALVGAVDFLSCYPPITVYPFGYLPVFSFILLQTYAISRYQKASLSEIFRAMEDGIVVTGKNKRILEINPCVERILGVPWRAILDKDPMDVLSILGQRLEDPEGAKNFIEKSLGESDQITEVDIGFREPVMQLNIKSSPIKDRFGTISEYVVVLKDITKRKEMELELKRYKEDLEVMVDARTQELRKSEEKYKALVSHAQIGIGIHQNLRFVFANEQLNILLGFSKEEITGLAIEKIIHPDEKKLILQRALERYNGLNPVETYDVRLIRKDGSIMPAFISNAVIDFQGKKATLITIVDTTDSRLRKDLELANHELEMFAYSVSHDLRAPLRSIDGFSQALLEDYQTQLDEEGKDYLVRIRTASQR